MVAYTETLSKKIFPAYRIALLHSRLGAEQKDALMTAFAAGEIDILVSTTVIEVGVDVANANVMVVENAAAVRPFTAPPAAPGASGAE